ncbi:hypothetical protein AVEN_52462-1 [Araneus ventricosus]|uniref:Uncharacterized protein n=1 Tax=Araneus ventricosus TaxID=182803 RepID=A0A4Y2CZB2_ARAVE|nr:hypothetical protein AVEN_52462-1 [Araneus ventricosus]
MSRFEATQGLFWDGPRNFEPLSDDEHDTWTCILSSTFRTTPTGGRLTPYDGSKLLEQNEVHRVKSGELRPVLESFDMDMNEPTEPDWL